MSISFRIFALFIVAEDDDAIDVDGIDNECSSDVVCSHNECSSDVIDSDGSVCTPFARFDIDVSGCSACAVVTRSDIDGSGCFFARFDIVGGAIVFFCRGRWIRSDNVSASVSDIGADVFRRSR